MIAKDTREGVRYALTEYGMTLDDVCQSEGLAQGPGLAPTKFNISVDPILWELPAAGAGIKIGDHTILGTA